MLGLWTAPDSILEQIKLEVGADFVVNTLHEAATIVLAEASGGKPVRTQSSRRATLQRGQGPRSQMRDC
jgi:hypothetical protein